MGKINYKLLSIVLVISLLIFFSGNYLLNNYKVKKDLHENLTQIEGVEEVEVEDYKSSYRFKIVLNQIKDLRQTFSKIEEKIEESIEADYKLEFTSNSSFKLPELESQIDLALYEACKTGEFIELGQRVRMYKTQYDLSKADIQVDNEYIYVNLMKNGKAIYKVINRKENVRG